MLLQEVGHRVKGEVDTLNFGSKFSKVWFGRIQKFASNQHRCTVPVPCTGTCTGTVYYIHMYYIPFEGMCTGSTYMNLVHTCSGRYMYSGRCTQHASSLESHRTSTSTVQ